MSTSSTSQATESDQATPKDIKSEVPNPLNLSAFPSEFDWILDKNLLRDEGVYFGLSEANEVPMEKVNAIRHCFQERIKVLEKTLEMERGEADFCRSQKNESELQIENWRKRLDEIILSSVTQPHNFWRYALGAAVYITILVCNFWLIQSWLALSNLSSPGLITLGVYLFGSVSIFSRASQLYHSETNLQAESDHREAWKTYLEEWVIPFVVALYVVFQGYTAHSLGESIMFFCLIFSLFLFVGKGFFNTLILVKSEYEKLIQNQKARRMQKANAQTAKAEMERNEIEAKEFLQQELVLKRQILEDEKARILLMEQQESNVSLFLSEFGLAKAMRHSLNHKQLSQIISNRR